MRRLFVVILGLTLVTPVLGGAGQTPMEQFRALAKAYHDQVVDLSKQYAAAKTEADKARLYDQAFKDKPAEYAAKMMALAQANTKDPAALDALLWICTQGVKTPQAPDALDVLLRDYGTNDRLATICAALIERENGEELLRTLRAKVANKTVQIASGYFLAQTLHDKKEPTREQEREAEKLLKEFLEQSANTDTIPHPLVKLGEGLLYEVTNLAVGKVAPEAEAEDMAGKPAKLSTLKGKVVVLDFWATWCVECVAMFPHERELIKKYADKPFALVGVSADEKKETLNAFIGRQPAPGTQWWSGEQGLVEKWNIHIYPTLYVIDAKGVIRAKLVGGMPDLEKQLDALVEKLVQEAG